ncbi:MAG: HAMP domain-containing protein [Spartobacteria bacterium]|nr:HAMP domain-containing protein [Spartobacteria bacterium]
MNGWPRRIAGVFSRSNMRVRFLGLLCIGFVPMFFLLWHAATANFARESLDTEQDMLRLSEVVAGNVEEMLASTRQLLWAAPLLHDTTALDIVEQKIGQLAEAWPFVVAFGFETSKGTSYRHLREIEEQATTYRLTVASTTEVCRTGFVVLDFSWLDHLLVEEKITGATSLLPRNTLIAITDADGAVKGAYPRGRLWPEVAGWPGLLAGQLRRQPEGASEVTVSGDDEHVYAYCRVKGATPPLYAVVSISRREALSAARETLRNALVGLLLTGALLGVAVWYGADILVVRPVTALTNVARRLCDGDMRARARLTGGPHEILSLATAFDAMAEAIIAHEQRLRKMTLELSLAEDQERRRIAHLLHDNVGPLLASCYMKLGALRDHMDDRQRVAGAIRETRELLDVAVKHTQTLTYELSSPTLHTLGVHAALDQLCQEARDESGLRIRFVSQGDASDLAVDRCVVLYQAVRELLRNALRHASAESITVRCVSEEGHVTIMVQDDGIGFDDADAGRGFSKNGGYGLFNLRERFTCMGGAFTVKSNPGCGTLAEVILPRQAKDAWSGEEQTE